MRERSEKLIYFLPTYLDQQCPVKEAALPAPSLEEEGEREKSFYQGAVQRCSELHSGGSLSPTF